jgi:hypothetical protein
MSAVQRKRPDQTTLYRLVQPHAAAFIAERMFDRTGSFLVLAESRRLGRVARGRTPITST